MEHRLSVAQERALKYRILEALPAKVQEFHERREDDEREGFVDHPGLGDLMLEELYFAVASDDFRFVTYNQVKRAYHEMESDFITLTRLISRLGVNVLECVGEELRRIYYGIRDIPRLVWFRVVKCEMESSPKQMDMYLRFDILESLPSVLAEYSKKRTHEERLGIFNQNQLRHEMKIKLYYLVVKDNPAVTEYSRFENEYNLMMNMYEWIKRGYEEKRLLKAEVIEVMEWKSYRLLSEMEGLVRF
ncbi:hypothetical protein QAD02_000417 [Eretmocerus hayati]|uniref:Uncharacterized protein n=1 Tax=Eretmocerus hayati TaxID=131215 RepID=A0ACC2NDE6_9HYME|nr:hypothetical protein QAD02_000417 [Eretmocerus hayati]